MIVTTLSIIPGYTFNPHKMRKVYTTPYTHSLRDLKNNFNNINLTAHGEIFLTKTCDNRLAKQAKKHGYNAVLGVDYVPFVVTGMEVGDVTSMTKQSANMYAQGEAVKLVPMKK